MLISKSVSAGQTDIGKVRARNEDHYLVADLNKSMTVHSSTLPITDETELYAGLRAQLLLVADGMGGRAGGNLASQISVGTTAQYVLNTMPWFLSLEHDHDDDQREELIAALQACREAVMAEAQRRHPDYSHMGTTLTMAYIVWPRMYVVHIGDSRCYVWRHGRLTQMTRDHTAAQALIDDGTMTAEEAARSPLSHILISSIGKSESSFQPDVLKVGLEPGDVVLLCTDGLSNQVPDEQIGRILAAGQSAEETTRTLIDAANEAGGKDNITAVVSICQPPIER